uniref:Uncharacterized protein n=1 Tax=Glossina pallidipes TaxID=7398 RepID=A0A1A9ZV80_GLOPL
MSAKMSAAGDEIFPFQSGGLIQTNNSQGWRRYNSSPISLILMHIMFIRLVLFSGFHRLLFCVKDYHDDIRQEQMWEMQVLTSSSSINNNNEAVSPNRLIEGGITDMDTSNDDKSDNELTGMDCTTSEKNENPALRIRNSTNTGMLTSNGTVQANTTAIHPSAMAAALQHQLSSAAASLSGLIKPTPASMAAVTGLTTATPAVATAGLTIPNEADTTASTLTFLEPPGTILHPALRNVKTINIAGNLTRKRPLLGVPRSSMNQTKRTVMTLLARAKTSQTLHTIRNPVAAATATAFSDQHKIPKPLTTHLLPLRMLASPFIIPHQPMEQSMLALSKESLAQGV